MGDERTGLLVLAVRFQREFPDYAEMTRELRSAGLARTEGGERPKLTIKAPRAVCEAGSLYCIEIGPASGLQGGLPETPMVTHAARPQSFIIDADPPFGSVVEVLCEDHVGTYRLPWFCRSTPEGLRNSRTGELIEGRVIGWREPEASNLKQTAGSVPSAL